MVKEKGMTVLLTSHDLYGVEYLADEVLIMNHGRIVAWGTPSELKERFGKTLRVVTRNPIGDFEKLKRTLMELKDVKGVNPINSNSFEVQLSSLDTPLNEVLRATISQELEVVEIFTTTLNFEDVYLNIIRCRR